MAESETMSIDTSNEAQDDPLLDLSYDKLEELVETTLYVLLKNSYYYFLLFY